MKTLLSFFALFLFVGLGITVSAQELEFSTNNKKALKQYKNAESAYKQQNYTGSEAFLKKALRHDPQFIEAWLLIGDVYREMNQPEQALDAFNSAIGIDSSFFPRAYYFTGTLYYQSGDYAASIDQFTHFLALLPEPSPLRKKVMDDLDRSVFAKNALDNPIPGTPVNAGSVVNSPNDDYVNYISVDKKELVMTRKEPLGIDQNNRVIYSESFYKSVSIENTWQQPDSMKMSWSKGFNLGGMNISVDGRKMYFTGCNWPGGFGSCDLYVSFRSGDEWEQPSNLGTLVNSQWWDSQPFNSANGKQLLFASKRARGKGKTDIWMAIRQADGKWSSPINLGDSINTAGSEMAPFLHPDGKTLYFSSDGRHGLGGYDLFISRKDEAGRWSKAENLGYPLNTRENEINLVVDLNGKKAWISSDRSGGNGKMDIYYMDTYQEMKPQNVSFIRGIVRDEKSKQPISAFVELSNLRTGLNEDSTISDRINGEFLMVLQPGVNYAFNISADGYMLYSENFNLNKQNEPKAVEKTFFLSPVAQGNRITLENVYFELNSAELLVVSFIELDKLLELMNSNSSIRLRIEGHTDNTGTDQYNASLSEDRAKSVYNYLTSKGIDPVRLEWKGYGSSRPVATNETETGRSENRRTEIVIL